MIKNTILSLLLIAGLGICPSVAQQKLKRSESFFGFHFDFHATAEDTELGKNFDTDLLDTFLQRTRPDYIQIDSKGHFGFSSYPTKVGYSANSFVKDPIRIWKEMADKHHLPLYVHYSGLRDDEAIRQHPEWSRLNADGSRDTTRVKVGYLSDYSDQLLIPQLKELIDNYQIDGAWIDGDCWAAFPDYSPAMRDGFLKATGLSEVPIDSKAENYERWKAYNQDAFKQYVRHYVDEIHRYRPDFQITSNWAYSSRMPEPIDVDVDFLSGDVAGTDCVYSAAFEARCFALQGKSWDLMSWGMIPVNFWGGTHTLKPVIQLKQEAAEVMAMGGGYQVYFRQNRDGAFQALDVDGLSDLANFCRERQPFCQYSETIPQIGIWYSLDGLKEQNKHRENLYNRSGKLSGVLNLFLDGQHSVEILMDHHIDKRMDQYALIVIPEWTAFNPAIKEQLLTYVHNGGNLLIIGANAVSDYKELLQVTFTDGAKSAELMIGDSTLGGIAGLKTVWQPVEPKDGATIVGNIYSQTDYRYATEHPVATVNKYGNGKVGAVYMDLSGTHRNYRNPVFSKLLTQIIGKLVPDPVLEVQGSEEVHVVLGKKNGNMLIHLINASGHHADEKVFGYTELRPVPPLEVSLKIEEKPKEVVLQPTGDKLAFQYAEGVLQFGVPPVAIYDIIEIVSN